MSARSLRELALLSGKFSGRLYLSRGSILLCRSLANCATVRHRMAATYSSPRVGGPIALTQPLH